MLSGMALYQLKINQIHVIAIDPVLNWWIGVSCGMFYLPCTFSLKKTPFH